MNQLINLTIAYIAFNMNTWMQKNIKMLNKTRKHQSYRFILLLTWIFDINNILQFHKYSEGRNRIDETIFEVIKFECTKWIHTFKLIVVF